MSKAQYICYENIVKPLFYMVNQKKFKNDKVRDLKMTFHRKWSKESNSAVFVSTNETSKKMIRTERIIV